MNANWAGEIDDASKYWWTDHLRPQLECFIHDCYLDAEYISVFEKNWVMRPYCSDHVHYGCRKVYSIDEMTAFDLMWPGKDEENQHREEVRLEEVIKDGERSSSVVSNQNQGTSGRMDEDPPKS